MSARDDKELQRFFTGDDPVTKAYRDLPSGAPPAALDAAILKSAREEAKRPVRPRWFVPLSVAATVVLGVGFSVKQLSTPLDSVSDIAYVPVAQEAAGDASLGRAKSDAPVPKPSRDALFEGEAEPDMRMKKIELDADSLRKQALSSQSFDISLDPGMLSDSVGTVAASSDDRDAFAPPPPVAVAPTRSAPQRPLPKAQAQAALPEEKEEAIAWAPRQENAELSQAIEARRRANEQTLQQEPSANFASASAEPPPPPQTARKNAQFADEIDQVVVTGHRRVAANTPLTEREQELVDQRLRRIMRQWRLGHSDEARVLFDAFIEDYPDYELPEDFPLQRPEPENTQQ